MAEPETPNESIASAGLSDLLKAASTLVKFLLLSAVAIFAVLHWNFFSNWLDSLDHAEVFGLKFDRKVNDVAAELVRQKPSSGDEVFLKSVINASNLLSPALQGAKVLWIDSNIGNNGIERRLLETLGIHVQVSWSLAEAVNYLDGTQETPDLVISNVGGSFGKEFRLVRCPIRYSAFPGNTASVDHPHETLTDFNEDQQVNPNWGFAVAETMAVKRPDWYNDHQRPRIIYYSGSTGGLISGACVRASTNQWDILLQDVVASIGTFRSDRLAGYRLTTEHSTSNAKSSD